MTSDGAYAYSKVPRIYVFGMFIKHEPSLGSLQRDVFLGGTSVDHLRGAEKAVEEESRKVSALLEKARPGNSRQEMRKGVYTAAHVLLLLPQRSGRLG